jgi:tripartite-type tricarboxylate transporter receptor subunit TctC
LSSVDDLKKKAISDPNSVNFATFGIGEATDLYRRWLGKEWKADITGVPYKGGNEFTTALLRGDVAVGLAGVGNALGQMKSGDIKVLFVRAAKRSALLPDVPTEAEVGLGSYPGGLPWWGLVAPAGVPDEIVNKLNAAFTSALADPEIVKFLAEHFFDPAAGPSADFATFMKKDRENVVRLVKEFHITPQ